MKKNFKFILFSLVFLFVCPFVFSACDEVKFENIPYVSSSANLEEVVRDFNSASEYMINDIGLKVNLETTNTYTYYDLATNKTSKVIKDVIKTTLGSVKDNPSIAVVDSTRYINNNILTNQLNTFVKTKNTTNQTAISYCYSNIKSYSEEGDTFEKDRNEYDSVTNQMITFFNSAICNINLQEVEGILQKEFEGITYYKLTSGVNTLETINDRFKEDKNLIDNPSLFSIQNKVNLDAVENFYYECAKNGSGYATYFAISYDLFNGDTEKYLSVYSVTKLLGYGDSVNIEMPEDIDEYTANGFMKTMQKENSFVEYSRVSRDKEESLNRTVWSVAKIGNDYSVRQEQYNEGAINTPVYYYFVYNKPNDYTGYIVNESEKRLIPTPIKLDLANFDFTLKLNTKNEDEHYYQFGNDETYTTINTSNEDIYSIKTTIFEDNRNTELTLFIENYGSDYSTSTKRFIKSIEDYTIVATS